MHSIEVHIYINCHRAAPPHKMFARNVSGVFVWVWSYIGTFGRHCANWSSSDNAHTHPQGHKPHHIATTKQCCSLYKRHQRASRSQANNLEQQQHLHVPGNTRTKHTLFSIRDAQMASFKCMLDDRPSSPRTWRPAKQSVWRREQCGHNTNSFKDVGLYYTHIIS